MLGNGRIEAQCFDGEKRLAHIRGKMRKKVCAQVLKSVEEVVLILWLCGILGVDQSGRHCPAFLERFPRRKSRCHRQIHR